MNITLAFVRQALAASDAPALVVGSHRLTYRQLLASVELVAENLKQAGIAPGDRVALVVAAPVGHVVVTLALACIGAVSVGLSAGSTPATVESLVEDTGAALVIHDRAQALPIRPMAKGQLRLDQIAAPRPVTGKMSVAQVDAQDTWRVMVSSGTTGEPKGVLCSHGATITNVNLQRVVFPTSPDDRVLIAMEASLGFATHYWLRVLHAGACAFLQLKGTPVEALRTIHEQGITQLITTPQTARAMAEIAQAQDEFSVPPPALRIMAVGGAAISPKLREALQKHVCPAVQINFGATETGLMAVLDRALQASHPQSAGRLLPWVEAQAVDDHGNPLSPGRVGALRIRSPAMCSGYARLPAGEHGPDPFRDSWFYSTDMGSITPDGLVFLSGRANDVINISGVKISPEQVESAIAEDPAVLDCVAVAVPGPLDQPMLVAVIVAREDVDIEALKRRCGALGRGCIPKLVLRADKLPRNAAGKLLRDEVRKRIRITRPDGDGKQSATY